MGDETGRLIHADALEALAELDAESIDAVVTDPPYGLEFMGKEWDSFGSTSAGFSRFAGAPEGALPPSFGQGRQDMAEYQTWCHQWAAECLRVLKPGGYLLAFGGTRTYHRLAGAVEDAGFEVRDMIEWVYGSGFPKSLDVAKQIDKQAGHSNAAMGGPNYERTEKGDPVTAEAAAWEGWGTALKPAHEPIVVARKPLVGTVAENVLAHGTGAINIDATRVATDEQYIAEGGEPYDGPTVTYGLGVARPQNPAGRWPPNVVLGHADSCTPEGCGEGCPVSVLDGQSGYGVSPRTRTRTPDPPAAATWSLGRTGGEQVGHEDGGTAARFFPQFSHVADEDAVSFRYTPKASTAQRNAGMEGMPEALPDGRTEGVGYLVPGSHSTPRPNVHPTVKPVGLMRWLIRLVTPPDGVVLDPFLGSGTTAVAAIAEDRAWVGIEREAEYATIAAARIAAAEKAVAARRLRERYEAGKARDR